MQVLKSKKGMTLMELIVGLVIFSVISVSLSILLAPMLFSYMRANDFAEYNALLDNIANQLISDLSNSIEEPDFVPNAWVVDHSGGLTITMLTRTVKYTVRNTVPGTGGVLQREGVNAAGAVVRVDVFSEDFYKRKIVSFRLRQDTAIDPLTGYILTVRLRENSNLGNLFEIEREYAVRPLMLNQAEQEDEEPPP